MSATCVGESEHQQQQDNSKGSPGQNATGQNATGQNAPEKNATGQNATGQNATGQNAPDKMPRDKMPPTVEFVFIFFKCCFNLLPYRLTCRNRL